MDGRDFHPQANQSCQGILTFDEVASSLLVIA
jgi:hypothetical protein